MPMTPRPILVIPGDTEDGTVLMSQQRRLAGTAMVQDEVTDQFESTKSVRTPPSSQKAGNVAYGSAHRSGQTTVNESTGDVNRLLPVHSKYSPQGFKPDRVRGTGTIPVDIVPIDTDIVTPLDQTVLGTSGASTISFGFYVKPWFIPPGGKIYFESRIGGPDGDQLIEIDHTFENWTPGELYLVPNENGSIEPKGGVIWSRSVWSPGILMLGFSGGAPPGSPGFNFSQFNIGSYMELSNGPTDERAASYFPPIPTLQVYNDPAGTPTLEEGTVQAPYAYGGANYRFDFEFTGSGIGEVKDDAGSLRVGGVEIATPTRDDSGLVATVPAGTLQAGDVLEYELYLESFNSEILVGRFTQRALAASEMPRPIETGYATQGTPIDANLVGNLISGEVFSAGNGEQITTENLGDVSALAQPAGNYRWFIIVPKAAGGRVKNISQIGVISPVGDQTQGAFTDRPEETLYDWADPQSLFGTFRSIDVLATAADGVLVRYTIYYTRQKVPNDWEGRVFRLNEAPPVVYNPAPTARDVPAKPRAIWDQGESSTNATFPSVQTCSFAALPGTVVSPLIQAPGRYYLEMEVTFSAPGAKCRVGTVTAGWDSATRKNIAGGDADGNYDYRTPEWFYRLDTGQITNNGQGHDIAGGVRPMGPIESGVTVGVACVYDGERLLAWVGRSDDGSDIMGWLGGGVPEFDRIDSWRSPDYLGGRRGFRLAFASDEDTNTVGATLRHWIQNIAPPPPGFSAVFEED